MNFEIWNFAFLFTVLNFPTSALSNALKSSKMVEIWGCYEQKADARFFEFQHLPGILQIAISEIVTSLTVTSAHKSEWSYGHTLH